MKLLAATLLALAHGAQAARLTADELNAMVDGGKIDKERLLRNAILAPRQLQNNYNYNANANTNAYADNNANGQYDGSNGSHNGGNSNNVNAYGGNYQNNKASYYYQSGNNYNSNGENVNQNWNQYDNTNSSAQEDVVYGYNYTIYDEDGNAQNIYNASAAPYYYNGDEDYSLPYNGNYTVRFNKCMSFATEDIDIIDDSMLTYYANSGVIVSQKSYVLFDIQQCEPGNCVFDESDLSKIHMTSLDDFIASFIEYFPNKKEAYCEQCLNHYNYCTSGDGTFFDNAVFRNGGAFCYSGQQYRMINCGQCYKMGCLTGYDDNSDSDVSEWVSEMAQCKQTNTYWKDYALYTGLTCNAEGDGVEFGVFVDEECKHYHRQKAFQNVIDNDDWQMLYQAPSVIEYMFTSSMTCKDDSEVRYINAFQPVYNSNGNYANYNYQQDGQQDAEAEEEYEEKVEQEGNTCQLGEEINQSCLDLFQYNLNGISLADCLYNVPTWAGSNNGNNNNNGNNGNSNGYNNNDNYNAQDIDEAWNDNGLYRYELSASDLYEMGKVCHIVANKYAYHASGGSVGALLSTYTGGSHKNVFSEDGSGSMFNYNVAKNSYYRNDQHDEVINSWGVRDQGLSMTEKVTYGLLGLVTGVIILFGLMRVYKKMKEPKDAEVVDKNLPLIS